MKRFAGLLFIWISCLIASCSWLVKNAYDNQPLPESRRTVITVGDAIQLRNLDYQNLSTTTGGNVTVRVDTLEPVVSFGTYSGQLRWDAASSTVQFSNNNGADWSDIGSGGGSYALNMTAHTGGGLYDDDSIPKDFAFLNSSTLQIVVTAKLIDNSTEDRFINLYGADSEGVVFQFYKSASNRLVFQHSTSYALPQGFATYSSTVLFPGSYLGRWTEYAVQMDDPNNTLTFYADGVIVRSVAMTTTIEDLAANKYLMLYDTVKGSGGTVKIGTKITWPTTGAKGISTEGVLFPGMVFYLPLTEGIGDRTTDVIQGDEYLLWNATWEAVPGGF